jgi:hypothetical protein
VADDERPPPSDSGWKGITGVVGGENYARGVVEPVTGLEERPCLTCKSFEQPDLNRVIKHLNASGSVEMREDGKFEPKHIAEARRAGLPVKPDGGNPMILDPHNLGWCRRDAQLTDLLATCPAWQPRKSAADFR